MRPALTLLAGAWLVALAHSATADTETAGPLRNILAATDIRAVVQGTQKYLWLATGAGLLRYDGRRFVFVGQAEGIRGAVKVLQVGSDGHVWTASDSANTLIEFNEHGAIKRNTSDLYVVRALLPEPGHIWAGDDQGVARIDLHANTATTHRMGTPVYLPRITALAKGSDGVLWAGGESGLWRVADEKMINVWPAPAVLTLNDDPSGAVYVSTTDRRLWKIEPGTNQPMRVEITLRDKIRFISQSKDDSRWVATDTGVLRWRGQTFERFLSDRQLPRQGASVALEDHEGSVWIGTSSPGLMQLPPPSPFSILGPADPFDMPFGTYPSQAGGVWTLSGAGKLRRHVDLAVVEEAEVPHDMNKWSWRNLIEVNKGDLWIGSLAKTMLHFVDGRWEQAEKAAGVDMHGVRTMLRTRAGRLIVSYEDSGFAFLDRGGTWQFRNGQPSPCEGPVISMVELSDGRIAMASQHNGVCTFDGQRIERLIEFPPQTQITTLSVERDRLWVGSDKSGLFLWENGRLMNLSKDKGLVSNHVGQVFRDGVGSVWLSSRDGIFQMSEKVLLDTLYARRPKAYATTFGAEDGLPSVTCLWGWNATGLVDEKGYLWMHTTNGVVVFKDPGHAVQTPTATAIIEEVVVNGESVPVQNTAARGFPRERGNLRFRYTFPTFIYQHRLRFRYRLRGFDEVWTTVGDRATAGFTNVPPGQYTFEVAAWFDGQDPDVPGPVALASVRLLPPFYSWWVFRFAVALAAAALGFGLWILRQRQHRNQIKAITEERTRIARDLHDTLDQTFVAVGLQLQAATAKLTDPQRAEVHIERANELIDRGLAEARGSIWALREEHPNQAPLPARLAVILGEMVRGTHVTLKVKSTGAIPDLPSKTRDEIVKILREAATNAIRHGQAQRLVVSVDASPGRLLATIEDDGTGFDPKQTRPGTLGLQGMLERARALGGTVNWQSSVSATERGTKVTFALPVRNAQTSSH